MTSATAPPDRPPAGRSRLCATLLLVVSCEQVAGLDDFAPPQPVATPLALACDPAPGSWCRVANTNVSPLYCGDDCDGVYDHSGAVLSYSAEEVALYTFGGAPSQSVFRLDLAAKPTEAARVTRFAGDWPGEVSEQSYCLAPSQPDPRDTSDGLLMKDGAMLVFGGRRTCVVNDHILTPKLDVWSFDLASREWSQLEVSAGDEPPSYERVPSVADAGEEGVFLVADREGWHYQPDTGAFEALQWSLAAYTTGVFDPARRVYLVGGCNGSPCTGRLQFGFVDHAYSLRCLPDDLPSSCGDLLTTNRLGLAHHPPTGLVVAWFSEDPQELILIELGEALAKSESEPDSGCAAVQCSTLDVELGEPPPALAPGEEPDRVHGRFGYMAQHDLFYALPRKEGDVHLLRLPDEDEIAKARGR